MAARAFVVCLQLALASLLVVQCIAATNNNDISGEFIIALKKHLPVEVLGDKLKGIEVISQTKVGTRNFITVKVSNPDAFSTLPAVEFVQPNKKVELIRPVKVEPAKGVRHSDLNRERLHIHQQSVQNCQDQFLPSPDQISGV